MISSLDLLYTVLAVMIIPVFSLICLVLWRTYKILGTVENITQMIDKGIEIVAGVDSIPMRIIKKFLQKTQEK
ncbi:hypothetical protein CSB09_01205 [Candidatus Gracilibacteria bacterium]|nr:MAG: hypothetical protein CSB09_01205 [Candidatus Gracilibacteria bacterium]